MGSTWRRIPSAYISIERFSGLFVYVAKVIEGDLRRDSRVDGGALGERHARSEGESGEDRGRNEGAPLGKQERESLRAKEQHRPRGRS
jgi:hypothetical protein